MGKTTLLLEARVRLVQEHPPEMFEVFVPCGRVEIGVPARTLADAMRATTARIQLQGPVPLTGQGKVGGIAEHATAAPVTLRRAARFPPLAGEWWQTPGEEGLCVGCPACGRMLNVSAETHRVARTTNGRAWTLWASDGTHTASVRCPYDAPPCDFHGFVEALEGWGEDAATMPAPEQPASVPRASAEQEHAFAIALARTLSSADLRAILDERGES